MEQYTTHDYAKLFATLTNQNVFLKQVPVKLPFSGD